ncbi:AsnC family transcriptional regulator [Clostridiaceae bacterium 35-E11]
MYTIDPLDQKILNEMQKGIPLTARPFLTIAEKFNIQEEEVLERIQRLKNNGYIRRFGGIFDQQKLGCVSTLVGMQVKKDIDKVASIVSQYPQVTHNYERKHPYNLWFTLIASSQEEIDKILNEIKTKTGITEILNLPAKEKYKTQVYFHLK